MSQKLPKGGRLFWLMVSGDIGLWWGESGTGSRICAPIFSDVRGSGCRELRLELGADL